MPLSIDIPRDWIIEAEPWQWATVMGVAGAVALGLYGWNTGIAKRSTGQGLPVYGRMGLGLLRFCAILLLGFLLLEPLIRTVEFEEERPVAVMLVDESESVWAHADSNERSDLDEWTQQAIGELEELGLVVERYGFASELRPLAADSSFRWDGAQTNLDAAIRSLMPRLENRNIAGVVVASDGLVNRGASPIYGVEWPNLPVWTVGLGDTTQVRDRWIDRINHNAVSYLGNAFPAQVFVESQGMDQRAGRVDIVHNGRTVATESWTTSGASERMKFDFLLTADATGMQQYQVRIVGDETEFDLENNTRTIYIEVLESRRLIACIGEAAHPDIGAMHMALSSMESYEIEVFDVATIRDPNTVTEALNNADVVIAHNLLGKRWGGMEWTRLLAMNDLPVWWWAADEGSWSFLQRANDLGVELTNSGDLNQTHRARLNPGFSALEWPDGLAESIREWPPMLGPFEQASWSPAWSPLLYRQFGDVETNDAFWGLRGSASGTKQVLTIGEGLWRWRMRSFALEQSHERFDAFIQRQVQFLAAKDARKRLNIQTEKRTGSDQRVVFAGQAYDAAWTPLRDATIEVTLTDEAGLSFAQTMLPAASGFSADFGRMPAGTYEWKATTELDGVLFDAQGLIIVEDIQIERTHLAADHGVLKRISSATGGSFLGAWRSVSPEVLGEAVAATGLPASVRHEQTELNDAIDWRLLLVAVLVLLTIEWIVRRRNLGY
jgi:hypothetical protein